MRLFLLTALTMTAFAANSILNRLALADGAIGPASFAALRVASGTVVLLILLALRDRRGPRPQRPKPWAVAGLVAYMLGFSFAYLSLDAGIGALILFGIVQVTMFAGALTEGERPPLPRWLGMALAMAGLALLSWPTGPVTLPPAALALMALAGLGWGIYSLQGRGARDPVASTAWNFTYALPCVLIALALWPDATPLTPSGVALAIASGGITSALGYALWYALLPRLGATRGALTQLSAPAIAMGLGALILSEPITAQAVIAGALILGGIAAGLAVKR